MTPEPLTCCTRATTPGAPLSPPVEVNIFAPGQLGERPLHEVRLAGTIDLSTIERFHYFNAWLMRSSFRVERPGQPRDAPRGRSSAALSDECTVTIDASLCCVLDFVDLGQAVIQLLKPLFASPPLPGWGGAGQ